MKYGVKIGSGAMICIPGFINIGSGILKLMGGGGRVQTVW
jgi:tetrahydrodipicolinate N-succinyltransferase